MSQQLTISSLFSALALVSLVLFARVADRVEMHASVAKVEAASTLEV